MKANHLKPLALSVLSVLCFACGDPIFDTPETWTQDSTSSTTSNVASAMADITHKHQLILDRSALNDFRIVDDRIRITLLGNIEHELHLTRVRAIGTEGYSWFGHSLGERNSYFSVTYRNGRAVGSARIGGQSYTIDSTENGEFRLTMRDHEPEINCETETEHHENETEVSP